jgi:hypothetical protein
MNRRCLALALLLSLTFASSQLLAKTSTIAAGTPEEATTENVGGDEQQSPPPKPAAKRPAAPSAPAKDKQQTQYRDRENPKAAPRWHRFIPGMIR